MTASPITPDKDGVQRLLEGGELRRYVCASVRRFTVKMMKSELARTILGKDFIPPEEIATARGVPYTDDQLATFGDRLPDQEALEWCRDNGMMLVAGPPKAMSLLEVRDLKNDYLYSKRGSWYAGRSERFARNDRAEPIWIAFRKEPVAGSSDKDWPEQQALVAEPTVVPNAAEVVWGLTTYKAVRGVYLLPNLYVRTASVDSDGSCVRVGRFDSDGIGINVFWDDHRASFLGVSAARKFRT
jgi:hypothetical protein